jgi:hypothetical protein
VGERDEKQERGAGERDQNEEARVARVFSSLSPAAGKRDQLFSSLSRAVGNRDELF